MKLLLGILTLVGVILFFNLAPCFGHGGQYKGPGGTVPPNVGGPGVSAPASANTPTPSGPSAPPTMGSGGVASAKRGGGSGGLGRKRAGGYQGMDRWEFWWEYNKDTYLNIKDNLSVRKGIVGSSPFLISQRPKEQFITSQLPSAETIKSEILPPLLESLNIDHPDIQDSSVLAIARITQAQDAHLVLDKIKKMISSKHKSAQQSACLSLGVLGSEDSIPILRSLIFNTPEGRKLVNKTEVPNLVRAFAALSMGLIGKEAVVKDLIQVVDKGDQMTQKDLISCAITGLGLLGSTPKNEEIADFLSLKLHDPKMDPFLKSFIPIALGKLKTKTPLASIVKALKKEKQNEWTLQSCVISLGQIADISDKEAIRFLMDYIDKGKDLQSRHLAFISLGQIAARDVKFKDNLDQHLKFSKYFINQVKKPSSHSNASWAALAGAIHAMPHKSLQADIIKTIGKEFTATKDPSNKSAFAISLGLLDAYGHADRIFAELLLSKNKLLQAYLCVGLGMMRWTKAAEAIREFAAQESVFFLRYQASVSLGLMGDTQAMNILVKTLNDGDTVYLKSSAAQALGQVGDVRAIEPLKKLLENSKNKDLARAFAVVALGIIGEKTPLPWNTQISANCNYGASTVALFEVLDIL